VTAASFSATPSLRSAAAKIITPPFDVIRLPLKAAVIFLPWTAGKAKGSDLSSVMADVAGEDQVDRMASATNPRARILTLHPPPSNPSVVNKMG